MKTKTEYSLRTVGNECIIIAGNSVDFTSITNLNESAARLWKELEGKEFFADNMVELLLSWYDVDENTARNDADKLIAAWLEAELIEI